MPWVRSFQKGDVWRRYWWFRIDGKAEVKSFRARLKEAAGEQIETMTGQESLPSLLIVFCELNLGPLSKCLMGRQWLRKSSVLGDLVPSLSPRLTKGEIPSVVKCVCGYSSVSVYGVDAQSHCITLTTKVSQTFYQRALWQGRYRNAIHQFYDINISMALLTCNKIIKK